MNSLSSLSNVLAAQKPKADTSSWKEDLGENRTKQDAKSFERELNSQTDRRQESDRLREKQDRSAVDQKDSRDANKREQPLRASEKKDSGKQQQMETRQNAVNETGQDKLSTEKKTAADPRTDFWVDTTQTNAVQNKGKQEPMLEFLDSMERELGVGPERILAAFALMPKETLGMPVSKTKDAFVQNLQLDNMQEPKAKALYSEMLQGIKLPEPSLQEAILPVQQNTSGQMALDKNWDFIPEKSLTPAEEKQVKLAERNAKLDALNNRFFNVYPSQENSEVVQNAQSMQASQPEANVMLRHQNRLNSEKLEAFQNKGEVNADVPNWIQNVEVGNTANTSEFNGFEQNAWSDEAAMLSGDKVLTEEEYVLEGEEGLDNLISSAKNQQKAEVGKMGAKTQVINANQMQVDGEKVAVNELVKKADLLLQRGGGEMKIQLNPENLGEVHLKVAVNEGKVDLHVTAEKSSTKKLIEAEIHHLKTGLADGKLDLRDIKVDTAQDMRNQLEQQLADQQRENARQFLDFFRNQHGSAQKAFNFANARSSYLESEDPNDAAKEGQQYQRRRSNENGRLSVVA